MNYKNLYDKIIANRQADPITEGYTERHHIVPRSLGGTDEPDNLVVLTAREHFICHYLLAKMYLRETTEWYKMNHAFLMMKATSNNRDRYFNSRLYEALRGNRSVIMSYLNKGNRNPSYGTRWIHSLEEKRSTRIGKNDPLPDGWNEGRIMDFTLKDKKEAKSKNKKAKILKEEIDANVHLHKVQNMKCSVREYCRNGHYDKSHMSLLRLWQKYIPDYMNKLRS